MVRLPLTGRPTIGVMPSQARAAAGAMARSDLPPWPAACLVEGSQNPHSAVGRSGNPVSPDRFPRLPVVRARRLGMRSFLRSLIGGLQLAATVALSQLPRPAHAQLADYPARKVTFVVGFAAGGGVDTMARIVAQALTEQFGYQIVIEDRPGAASNIAAKAVASAAPDGYTYLFSGNSLAINQTFYKNLSYSIDDLRAVAIAAIDSHGLAVNANRPFRTLDEFLDASHDKAFTFGYGGSSARIVSEYIFKVVTKTPAVGVPFQSGLPAVNALLGNHVDIIAGPVAEIYPQAQQGALRALAVTGARRAQAFPGVPTLSQVGFPGLEINGWVGLLAPAKTPPEICAKINAAVNAVVAKPDVDKRLRELGYEPSSVALADTATLLKTSIEKWGRMIQATGITAE
jgi:tripartite-type tricarboxylate transporter receptor subunit TctC